MQSWVRMTLWGIGCVLALVVLLVFLTIALKVALVLALLGIAYYFFSRAWLARQESKHWRS